MDFDRPCLCPDCGEDMEVLLPIWVTPGDGSIDTGGIIYDSSMKNDSQNWWCANCEDHHLPLDNENLS